MMLKWSIFNADSDSAPCLYLQNFQQFCDLWAAIVSNNAETTPYLEDGDGTGSESELCSIPSNSVFTHPYYPIYEKKTIPRLTAFW